KRHHVKSFLLAISENDQILCENGSPESTVLYGVLCACRGLGILPTIGLDKITGSWIPQSEGDPELRLASIAIKIAKLAGCPIILSPVRCTSVMHKIYTSQHDNQPLFIYADVAAEAFHQADALHGLAPYIGADKNVVLSSGESFILPNQPNPPGGSWTQQIYQNIVKCGWANDRHVTEASSKRPAQLAGLYPHKGHLTIGADADLVLWPENDRNKPVFTVVGGRIAVQYSQLRNSTPRDRENGNAIKAGYIVSEQGPCDSLTAIQDMIKELGKALQTTLSAPPSTPPQPPPAPPSEKAINKAENDRLGPSGDVAAAGLPTRDLRSIASQYKRDSLASTFKLTGM
uniref:Amidohydro-rel domain-containing protein n=1 Tax=Mesocestoides corti TaxID=53468 RepID=A0A5K3EHM0_MESCO